MTHADPRGTVTRCFSNRDGDLIALIKWTRGEGPAQVVGQFRDGQAVRLQGGKVVAV